VFSHYTNV